jgi:hypothetical protein
VGYCRCAVYYRQRIKINHFRMRPFLAAVLLLSYAPWCQAQLIEPSTEPQSEAVEVSLPPAARVTMLPEGSTKQSVTPGHSADLSTISYGAEVDFSLRRAWRDGRLSRSGVKAPGMVVSTWLSARDYTFSLAGDVGISPGESGRRVRETELSLSRQYDRGKLRIEPGFYLYLRGREFGSTTSEAALSLTRRSGPWRFLADGFVDVLHSPGDYLAQVGVSHRFSPGDRSLIKTSLFLGRSSTRLDDVLAASTDTVTYARLSASWRRDISDRVALRPHVSVTRFLSGLQPSESRTRLTVGLALEIS